MLRFHVEQINEINKRRKNTTNEIPDENSIEFGVSETMAHRIQQIKLDGMVFYFFF